MNFAEAAVVIYADAKQLTGQLTTIGASLTGKLNAIGQSAGRAFAVGLAAGGVAAGFAVKAASDLEETMSKLNVVFGANAAAVKAWGDEFASQVGRSKQQVADILSSSQDLFVPLGFDPAAAEAMSKQLATLAIDLGSFNNRADADVVRDLQAALTGSGEVMKKYGVVLSEARVQQELFNQGIDPKNASEAQKATARWNIILAGTQAAQGDAIRTADGFANQMKRLRGQLQDSAATIGGALLPLLTPLVAETSAILSRVAEWATNNQELVQTLATAGAKLLLVLGATAAVGKAASILASGFRVLSATAQGFTATLSFLAANPAVAALAAITAGMVALGVAITDTENKYHRLTDQAREQHAAQERLEAADRQLFERLESLADKQGLTNAEMQEADRIISNLQGTYGNLGLSIDSATGKMHGLTAAQGKLAAAFAQLKVERQQEEWRAIAQDIADLQAKRAEHVADMERLFNRRSDRANRREIAAADKEIARLEREKALKEKEVQLSQAVASDAASSPAGNNDAAKRAETKAAAEQDLADARKQAADARGEITRFDDDRRREGMTELERRIDDIRKETEAYKAALTKLSDSQRFNSDEELNTARQALGANLAHADQAMQDRIARLKEAAKAEAEAPLQDEILRMKVELQFEGMERQLKLLQLEMEQALRDAAERGIDPALIREKFNLQAEAIRREAAEQTLEAEKPPEASKARFEGLTDFARSLQSSLAGDPAQKARNQMVKQGEKQIQQNQKMIAQGEQMLRKNNPLAGAEVLA